MFTYKLQLGQCCLWMWQQASLGHQTVSMWVIFKVEGEKNTAFCRLMIKFSVF